MKRPSPAKKVFSGVIFDVYQWKQKMFDGTLQTFERLKRPDTVDVIAVTDNKILVISDEQPGRDEITCLPGGRLDPDEKPQIAAVRELLEETGYESNKWKLLCQEQPVSKIDWTIYTFIARDITFKQKPHLDAGEKIRPSFITFEEFMQLIRDNKLHVSKSLHQLVWEATINENKKSQLLKELGL